MAAVTAKPTLMFLTFTASFIFFFFKQKTAYEIVRLLEFRRVLFRSQTLGHDQGLSERVRVPRRSRTRLERHDRARDSRRHVARELAADRYSAREVPPVPRPQRSEERRVGKECRFTRSVAE